MFRRIRFVSCLWIVPMILLAAPISRAGAATASNAVVEAKYFQIIWPANLSVGSQQCMHSIDGTSFNSPGLDPSTKGRIDFKLPLEPGMANVTRWDECTGSGTLKEWSCNSNGLAQYNGVNCLSGCSNGHCVKPAVPVPPAAK
jgi:hypothetical protein